MKFAKLEEYSFAGIKSTDELIKTAVSIFKQLQQKYSEEDLLFAMKNDPSYDQDLSSIDNLKDAKQLTKGKLGKFVKFILTHLEEIKNNYHDDIDNILQEYLIILNTKNINFNTPIEKFESVAQLKETIDSYAAQLNPIKDQKDFEQQIKNVNPDETQKYEIGSDIVIIHPQTAAESAYWGSGTTWCTSNKNLKGNYFDSYTENNNNFYIIIDKITGEKYGYAEKTGELQDRTNNPMLKNLFTLEMLGRENGKEVLYKLYELTKKEEFLVREETNLYTKAISEANRNNERNVEWYLRIPDRIVKEVLENNDNNPELAFKEVKRFWDTCLKNIDYTNDVVVSRIPGEYKKHYNYIDKNEFPKKPRTYEEHKQRNNELLNSKIENDSNGNKITHSIYGRMDFYSPIYDMPNLPEDTIIGGNLDLRGTYVQSLPENLKVNGSVLLADLPIQYLPEGLSVGSGLYLASTPIQSLPESLSVGGNLDLSHSQIQSLPEGLSVGGDLDLKNTSIRSLPNNLTVGGDLLVSYTYINSLPENLTVGGNLDLDFSGIESVPENLTVGGLLSLGDSLIQSLPKNLNVGGSLYLHNSLIQSLPEGLNVGGTLYLGNTQIQSLPENLTVGESLDLEYSKIQSLPENLTIKSDLFLRDTPIKFLPENLSVGGELDIRDTQIRSLPKSLNVGGTIHSDNNLQEMYDKMKEEQAQQTENVETEFSGKENIDELVQNQVPEEFVEDEEIIEDEHIASTPETIFRGIKSIERLITKFAGDILPYIPRKEWETLQEDYINITDQTGPEVLEERIKEILGKAYSYTEFWQQSGASIDKLTSFGSTIRRIREGLPEALENLYWPKVTAQNLQTYKDIKNLMGEVEPDIDPSELSDEELDKYMQSEEFLIKKKFTQNVNIAKFYFRTNITKEEAEYDFLIGIKAVNDCLNIDGQLYLPINTFWEDAGWGWESVEYTKQRIKRKLPPPEKVIPIEKYL